MAGTAPLMFFKLNNGPVNYEGIGIKSFFTKSIPEGLYPSMLHKLRNVSLENRCRATCVDLENIEKAVYLFPRHRLPNIAQGVPLKEHPNHMVPSKEKIILPSSGQVPVFKDDNEMQTMSNWQSKSLLIAFHKVDRLLIISDCLLIKLNLAFFMSWRILPTPTLNFILNQLCHS